jgi:hypothetical protein
MLATLIVVAAPLGSALASVSIESQSGEGLVLRLEVAGIEQIRDEAAQWAGLTARDFFSLYDDTLGLTYPGATYTLAVPVGAKVSCQVTDASYYEIADEDFARFGAHPELLDRIPARPAEITAGGYLRRQRVVGLKVAPLVYDSASGRLRVYTGLTVRVDFAGGPATGTMVGAGYREEGSYEATYRAALLNYDQGRQWRRRVAVNLSAGDYFSSSPSWAKILTETTGVYCLTGQDLASAGVLHGTVSSQTLRLYSGGGLPLEESLSQENPSWMRQVPIRVSDGGDGTFGSGDSIIFYGLGAKDWANLYDKTLPDDQYSKNFYSDLSCYWLTWGGSFQEAPARMPRVTLPSCQGCTPYTPTSYTERLHYEIDNVPDFDVRCEDAWFWRSLKLGDALSVYINATSPDVSKPARVRVRLVDWHRSGECRGAYFYTLLRLNGAVVADSLVMVNVGGGYPLDLEAAVTPAASDIQRIDIVTPASYPGVTLCDRLYLAWCELIYARRFLAARNSIFFGAPDTTATTRYAISGFTSGAVYVFDVTDQFAARQLRGAEVSGGPSFTVTITDTTRKDSPRRYAVIAQPGLLKPAEIQAAQISDVRHDAGAEYCVITHRDLIQPAQTIADFHDGELVTTDQIYDEFGWGVPEATAIRDFLRWRLASGSPIARVLLFGDASWDVKDYLGYENFRNFVPTYERRFLPPEGKPYSTDDWLAYLEPYSPGDSFAYWPTIPIARIPADSPEDGDVVVSKTMDYTLNPERGVWQSRVMVVADDDRIGSSCGGTENSLHTLYAELLVREAYPAALEPIRVYLTEYPLEGAGFKPAARADFIKNLNQGVLMTNFVGHGDQYRLAQEEVFNPNSVQLVNAGKRQTFFIAASCNVSRFDEPASSSMCEELLRRSEGATIGSLASTHLCMPFPNQILNDGFVRAIFSFSGGKYPVIPVADAAQVAKQLTVDWEHYFYTNNEMYALLGDPALEIASPPLDIIFTGAQADTLKRRGVYSFSCRVMDGGTEASHFDGLANIQAREAADTSGFTACTGAFLQYELEGLPIHRGKMNVENGRFDFGMFVSVDAREGRDASVRCFATDGETSASGVLDGLAIMGEDPADDNVGPDISLESEGRTLESGDTVAVGQRVVVNMVDDSGVAIKSKSEFISSVSLSVDDGDRQNLTDSVYAVGGDFTRSAASFTVPSLPPGSHRFTVWAFDNLANLESKDYVLVVEAKAGELTNVAYAYPNPASDYCYFICQYDRGVEVDIAVYTVSGRKIWTHASALAAYHEVFWDCTDSQGDRVSNGTYIVKVGASDPGDAEFTASKTIMVAVIR